MWKKSDKIVTGYLKNQSSDWALTTFSPHTHIFQCETRLAKH